MWRTNLPLLGDVNDPHVRNTRCGKRVSRCRSADCMDEFGGAGLISNAIFSCDFRAGELAAGTLESQSELGVNISADDLTCQKMGFQPWCKRRARV